MRGSTSGEALVLATLLILTRPSLGHAGADGFQDRIKSVETSKIALLTGSQSVNETQRVDVVGTDLGTLAEMEGKIYIAFGDTFSYRQANWRSNVMAYTTDLNPADGVALEGWITDDMGRARELVPGRKEGNEAGGEVTKIPTALAGVGGRLYLAFMSVRHWGPPGRWDANYATWAYSDDRGNTWSVVDPPLWAEGSNFIMLAVSQQRGRGNEDGYLWILATPAGRFGPVRCARVVPGRILDSRAYEYYAGQDTRRQPRWVSDPSAAVEVIPAPAGEGSLLWNPYLDRWIYTYLNEHTHNLEVRSSPYPWGPWSEAHTLAQAARYPALYGAFMTPSWVEDGGRVVYFLMSQFTPYNVYVMRAEFERK